MAGPNQNNGDVTPPLAPVITGFSDDTGTSNTDRVTKDDRLVMTGTAEALASVEVFVDGASVGTTTADGSGNWTFDHSGTPLMQGAVGVGIFGVTAQACDAAGNLSEFSTLYNIEVDTWPPEKPIIVGISDDRGAESDDRVTNDQTLLIHGTGEPGSLVNVSIDGVSIGQVVVALSGQWSLDHRSSTVSPGTHVISAQAEDTAGNLSPPADDVAFVIDITAPTTPAITAITPDTGASNGDGITNAQFLVVSGIGPVGETIVLSATLGGTQVFPEPFTAEVAGDGSWTIDLTGFELPEGAIVLSAVSEDLAGNQSGAATRNITVDITPDAAPVIQAISTDTGRFSTDGVTSDRTISVSGTALPSTDVEVVGIHAASGGLVTFNLISNSQGDWSAGPTAELATGDWLFTATSLDLAGNAAASAPFAVEIDNLVDAPVITGISDDSGASANDGVTFDTTLKIHGTGEPGGDVTLLLDGAIVGTGRADPAGAWTVSIEATPLAFGTYAATAWITDLAGNSSSLANPFSVTVEDITATPPAILSISQDTGASATDGITRDNTLVVTGTAAPTAQVEVFAGSVLLGTATTDRAGNWSLDLQNAPFADGSYTLTAEILGPGSTRSAASQPFALTVATSIQAPTIDWLTDDTGASARDWITKDTTPVFGGTAAPNATLVLEYAPSIPFGTVQADASGNWSSAGAQWYTQVANNSFADGTYHFFARVTDLAGNTATAASPALMVDTVAAGTARISSITDDGRANVVGTTTKDASLEFEGTGIAGDVITLVAFGAAGTVSLGTATVHSGNQWRIANTPALADGDWSFKAEIVDLAGNTGVTPVVTPVTIDRTPPSLSFGLTDGVLQDGIKLGVTETANHDQAFGVEAEAGATVTFQLPNGITFKDITKTGTGKVFAPTARFTSSFSDTLTAIATDAAGNSTTKSIQFTYNAPPDAITLPTPEIGEHSRPGTRVSEVLVTEAGAPSDLAKLTLTGASPFALVQDGSGKYSLVLAPGQVLDYETQTSHTITLLAEDTFGSTKLASVTISVLDQLETITGGAAGGPLVGTPGKNIFVGSAGPDAITGGGGGDDVTMGAGADSFSDSPMNFDGTRFTDFGREDRLVFTGAALPANRFSLAADGKMSVDTDGDGTPDMSFQMDGDFSTGTFMAVRTGTDTTLTFEPFLPGLADQSSLSDAQINGIENQAYLTGDGTADFKVTLQDMGFALFDNAVGVYEIDAVGNILDPRILFANANADKSATTTITDVEAGHRLGFFVVQNAATWAAAIGEADRLVFLDSAGGSATLADGPDLLLSLNGTVQTAPVFHSFDAAMNTGGLQRAVSGVSTDGRALLIGFEDTTHGGDRDYEDVVMQVENLGSFFDGLG